MSRNRFHPKPEQLPGTMPLFPLPGALILPDTHLPLNIFEPRYVTMTLDALRADRMIGMIQPNEAADPGADGAPAIFAIGTAGRITSFSETDDGCLLVSLYGVARFRVREELATIGGYRRAAVDWSEFLGDLGPPGKCGIDRAGFIAHVRAYFEVQGLKADWNTIDKTPLTLLINTLAVVCPLPINEKQALLEAPSIDERARVMDTLIEMALREDGDEDIPRH